MNTNTKKNLYKLKYIFSSVVIFVAYFFLSLTVPNCLQYHELEVLVAEMNVSDNNLYT